MKRINFKMKYKSYNCGCRKFPKIKNFTNYFNNNTYHNSNKRNVITDSNDSSNCSYNNEYYLDSSFDYNKKSNKNSYSDYSKRKLIEIDNNKNWILNAEKDKDIYEKNKLYLKFNLDKMKKEDYLIKNNNKKGFNYEESSFKFIKEFISNKCYKNTYGKSTISYKENGKEIEETITINPYCYLEQLSKEDLQNILKNKHI
jgi:hypothetical protein